MREVLGVKTVGGKEDAVRAAVEAIVGGRTRAVDCQQLDMTGNDGEPLTRFSLNTVMAGFGPDANAVAERRRWLGPMRYDISVKTEILKLPCRKPLPAMLTVDGEATQLDDLFLFTCFVNKHTGIRHRLAPFAQFDDGKLDLCYTNRPLRSIPKAAKLDGQIKSGGKHVNDPIVTMKQTRSVVLETSAPAKLMVDGDLLGTTPLAITVREGAFRMLTPETPAPS